MQLTKEVMQEIRRLCDASVSWAEFHEVIDADMVLALLDRIDELEVELAKAQQEISDLKFQSDLEQRAGA